MNIKTKYDFGEMVYLHHDIDQRLRMVTGFNVRPGTIRYELAFGTTTSWHEEIEISREQNINLKLNI